MLTLSPPVKTLSKAPRAVPQPVSHVKPCAQKGQMFSFLNSLDFGLESTKIYDNPKGPPLLAGRFRSEGKIHLLRVATRGLKL